MTGQPLAEFVDVSFMHDDHLVLEHVNLKINRGEYLTVVGPNGGGKTTLLKLLLGLIQPAEGKVRLFGVEPSMARKRTGYVPQFSSFDSTFPIKVRDVVLMGRLGTRRLFGIKRSSDISVADEAMEKVDILDLADRPVEALSGGQRQRVLIARALACRPDLLLLDEPTANLDMKVAGDLYELLKKLNESMTLVLVSHDLSYITAHATRVACVNKTMALHDSMEAGAECMLAQFGAPMKRVRHNSTCSTEHS